MTDVLDPVARPVVGPPPGVPQEDWLAYLDATAVRHRMESLEAQAQASLVALGSSPSEVAANLKIHACQGRRSDATTCPLARYLRKQLGSEVAVYACGTELLVGPGVADLSVVDWPRPVKAFQDAFDAGLYPELRVPDDSPFVLPPLPDREDF